MQDKVLMVEGTDDQHVIWSLLKHHDVPQVFEVEQKGGVERLLSTFPVQLKASNVNAVGVVLDADVDLSGRWESIRSKLDTIGYVGCPAQPPAEGLVLTQEELPRFGAWLMPDNSLPGMLEDFVCHLIPDKDGLWPHCQEVLAAIPKDLREFADIHTCKAQIHTWLAWKADPGTPMGLAITKKYLSADASAAKGFLAWLNRLFVNA